LCYQLACLIVVGVLPGNPQTLLVGPPGATRETDGNVRY
jgi:hypothetical protein